MQEGYIVTDSINHFSSCDESAQLQVNFIEAKRGVVSGVDEVIKTMPDMLNPSFCK